MVSKSGGEVNRLFDRRLVQRLPTADVAHGDLLQGHQGPKQHGRRFGVEQAKSTRKWTSASKCRLLGEEQTCREGASDGK